MHAELLDRKLHEFMRHHRQFMKQFFSDCGLFNGHPFMLFLIRQHPGITPAQLARTMEIAPASATISLKRMETAGLLCRTPDETDHRVVRLTLTPEGERLDDRCRAGKHFAAETLFSEFSEDERRLLWRMLDRMQTNLAAADTTAWLLEQQKEETL